MISNKPKRIFVMAFAVIAAIALVRLIARAKRNLPAQGHEETRSESARQLSRVFERNGETFIRLTPAEQARAGIETVELRAASERRNITAPAVALEAASLVNLATACAAARANLLKAQNDVSVSRPEYQRMKILYSNQQNVSAKAFQAAEGAFRNDQSAAAAARRSLELQLAAVRQSWGDTVAGWVQEDSSRLDSVLSRKNTLIQVTLATDGIQAAPTEISLELPGKQHVFGKLVSRFPRVDPRIQGASFLYVTRTVGALEPGLNLVASVPQGPRLAGVVIPRSAVVWMNGEPWVYIEGPTNQFVRRAVDSSFPAAGGLFVSAGFASGDRVVSVGAQTLLSEEFRSQSSGEEEGDED